MTPTDPNSSLVANFDPAHRRIAPLYPITRARPIEEMEEKKICQPKSNIENNFRTMFYQLDPRNQRRDVALSPKCSTN